MTYHVELTARAIRDLDRTFGRINGENSRRAGTWFNRLEDTVFSLDQNPARGATTPEDNTLRQVFFGRKHNIYRIIYEIDETSRCATILHIRHGALPPFEATIKV